MTLPIERYKDAYSNWRYNPFTAADMAVSKEEDGLTIPSGSPFIIQLLEQPRYNDPSSVAVRCYGVKTDVDQDSDSGTLILYVASTVDFSPGDTIIIDRGGDREEERIIDTIQGGESLTVTVNLEFTHTQVQADDVEKYIAFTESGTAPAQSQFRVDYPPDDGEGTGLIEFNNADTNKEVRVNYKATGSPILEEYLNTKISYPAGVPDDNQIVGFSSGVPYWLQLPHTNLAGVTSDQHHPQAHTLASHSSKAHSELTGIGANDHHPQAHTLASHSTKAHAELTGVSANQHHAQLHAASHHVGGGDLINHDNLTGFLAAEHKSLPNTIAQVLSDHNKAAHDALDINADKLDGYHATQLPRGVYLARAYQSDSQTIQHNTWTKVNLQTENYDVGDCFAASRFTAKAAGKYSIKGMVHFGPFAVDKTIETAIYKNGSPIAYDRRVTPLSGSISGGISTDYQLAVDDYIELYVRQGTGLAKDLIAGEEYNALSVHLIAFE